MMMKTKEKNLYMEEKKKPIFLRTIYIYLNLIDDLSEEMLFIS